MKAWLLDSQSGLSALRLGEIPDPSPGPNEVVLGVRFASLNPADRYLAEGQYPGKLVFPHILGRDAVGTVLAVGVGVTNARVGETKAILRGEVGVSRAGTFAERVAVPAEALVDVPSGWTAQQAAGAPLVYLTAYQALTQWPVVPGPTAGVSAAVPGASRGLVLVSGASGGVGIAALQLASALGHPVVALSRDESKWPALLANGATVTYSPADAGWRKKLRAQFGKLPTALAIDNIGGAGFSELLETLSPQGRVSVVGRLAGPVPEFNTGALFFRRLQVGGVAVGTFTSAEAQGAWGEIVRLLAGSNRSPLVDHTFAFSELLSAFERLRAGPLGKVLLEVGA